MRIFCCIIPTSLSSRLWNSFRQAARDPNVLAIKMTLYRVGRNSPIVAALLEAIEQGKQVAVLVELKARFDEESNIEWARTLEDAGVARGVRTGRLKGPFQDRFGGSPRGRRHSPVRTSGNGQLQSATARLYTDFGFLTCDERIADDATHFLQRPDGIFPKRMSRRNFLVAPVNLGSGSKN